MQNPTNRALAQQPIPKSSAPSKYVAPVAKRFDGDATPEEVQGAIDGHCEQIRHLPVEVQESTLMAEVLALAKQYGAREDLDAATINEAVDFIIQSFPWLGVREIRTAFRWHASGKTKTPAGEMYGGLFTVRALGAILEQYNNTRKKIVAHYVELKAQEVRARIEAQREEQARAFFETKLLEDLARAKSEQIEWEAIPAWWHDSLHSRGILSYTDEEKRQAWEDSAQIEKEKTKEEMAEHSKEGGLRNALRLISIDNRDPQARRIAIAKKLLVHRKLILTN